MGRDMGTIIGKSEISMLMLTNDKDEGTGFKASYTALEDQYQQYTQQELKATCQCGKTDTTWFNEMLAAKKQEQSSTPKKQKTNKRSKRKQFKKKQRNEKRRSKRDVLIEKLRKRRSKANDSN